VKNGLGVDLVLSPRENPSATFRVALTEGKKGRGSRGDTVSLCRLQGANLVVQRNQVDGGVMRGGGPRLKVSAERSSQSELKRRRGKVSRRGRGKESKRRKHTEYVLRIGGCARGDWLGQGGGRGSLAVSG